MQTYSLQKRLRFGLILFAVSVCMSLFLAELYVRIAKDYVTPGTVQASSLKYEPALFARHVFPRESREIPERDWYINDNGYRGDPFTIPKPPGTVRVIVYGGSSAFDTNMPRGKDWPHRIEELFREIGVTNVEVINAGIPGHASFDSFGRFFAEGHLLEPDYVVLYNGWNDIKHFGTSDPLLRNISPFRPERDYRNYYQSNLDFMLCEFSQLYVRLRAAYYSRKIKLGPEGVASEVAQNQQIAECSVKQFRVNVEMFVDLAENINAQPVLVTQARLISSKNTDEEKSRIRYEYLNMSHATVVEAFDRMDRELRAVANSKGVPLVEAAVLFSGRPNLFQDHVHLQPEGSEYLAQILFSQLGEQLQCRQAETR